jgi:hypothetical protein
VRRRAVLPRDVVVLRGLAVPVRPLALLDAAVEAGAGGAALLHRMLRDRVLRDGVGAAQLHAVAGRAAGAASAVRLLARADLPNAVTPAAPGHLEECPPRRNRYS